MPKIKVLEKSMKERKLYIATPMYAWQCTGGYDLSLIGVTNRLSALGIHWITRSRGNESHITRARNYLVGEFLRSECTHLLFWDADIEARSEYVLQLLALADPESKYDIIGAPYCVKRINWNLVRRAVIAGVPADDLERFTGHYVVNFLPGSTGIELDEPAEVATLGAGFMMIQRRVFERLAEVYPETYVPDGFDDSKEPLHAFFNDGIVGNRFLTEDYWFCNSVRNNGMRLWVCPWMQLKHQGTYIFEGTFAAEAILDELEARQEVGNAVA